MTYRIVNTSEAIEGPHGIRYVHDAARPWMVLRRCGDGDLCAGRFSTEKWAKEYIRCSLPRTTEVEPRTAAGRLD